MKPAEPLPCLGGAACMKGADLHITWIGSFIAPLTGHVGYVSFIDRLQGNASVTVCRLSRVSRDSTVTVFFLLTSSSPLIKY